MSKTWLDVSETWLEEPPTAECSTCHRQTWDADSIGASCGMPQPDGSICGGVFTNEARVRRYVEALPDEWSASTYEDAARAVIAVADEEQAALRAEVERWMEKAQEAGAAYANANTKHHAEWDRANRLERLADTLAEKAVDLEDRAWKAEAEVERLTRECLDRETTETDARERLRQAEERLDKVKAMHRLASDGQHCFTCVMPWHWPCPTASELQ